MLNPFATRLAWIRRVRPGKRRRSAALSAEPLEARVLLAADTNSSFAVNRITWNGEAVSVRTDSWIVRTATGPAAMGIRSGWQTSSLGEGYFSLVAPGASPDDIRGWAAATSAVRSVEPDRVVTASATLPNDPSFSRLWGLNNAGQTGGVSDADADAPEAWDVTTGSRSVVVAVVDSGLDVTHPDLAANIWTNPGEIAGNGIDDDHNGFVDDIHGWNFVDNTPNVQDGYGHGTHVAGVVAAAGTAGVSAAGIGWNVSLMALKFQDNTGLGFTGAAIAGIQYATMMRRDFGINVVVINNSWGGTTGFSTMLQDAIRLAGEAGITFVAAAGNSGADNDAVARYPSGYDLPNVIAVAATGSTGALAGFSNYGATTVDLGAPGTAIYSTLPGGRYGSL